MTVRATIDQAQVKPTVLVQPDEDVLEEMLERLQRVREREHVSRCSCRMLRLRGGRGAHPRRESTPPWLQGLQRRRRQTANTPPLKQPWARNASIAYWEQLGWYLQVPAGVRRPKRVAPHLDERDPDVSHAAALPSTSVTCSTSHSWPRESAGSATPERAAST